MKGKIYYVVFVKKKKKSFFYSSAKYIKVTNYLFEFFLLKMEAAQIKTKKINNIFDG